MPRRVVPFVVFLMLLLPFQFAWSAAAVYCGHEASDGVAQAHFGHHTHVHQASDDGDAAGVLKSSGNNGAAHADCNVCSAASTPLIPQLAAPQTAFMALLRPRRPEPGPLASALSRAPDRPQWLRLV